MSAVDAGGAGFLDDALKVAVIYVAQDLGQVAAGPRFAARGMGLADGFERGGADLFVHEQVGKFGRLSCS